MRTLIDSLPLSADILKELSDGQDFKFEDSALVFNTDGNFLYIRDIDSGEDLLETPFLDAAYVRNLFIEHHGQERLGLLQVFAGSGLFYSDSFNNSDIEAALCI